MNLRSGAEPHYSEQGRFVQPNFERAGLLLRMMNAQKDQHNYSSEKEYKGDEQR